MSGILGGAGRKLTAEAAGRALQFALAYYAQVTLGPAAYGHLVYGLAAGLVAGPLADAGLQLSVTREMAGDATNAAAVARAGLRLKIRLAGLALLALGALSALRPTGTGGATWAAASSVVAGTFVEYAGCGFRGLHRVADDAKLALAWRSTTAAAGAAALWWGARLDGFAWVLLGSTTIVAIVACAWLQRQVGGTTSAGRVVSEAALLRRAWPLGGAVALSMLYTRTPTFVLDALAGVNAVALFGVAQRLVEPTNMVPAALLAAVFPAIVKQEHDDPSTARRLKRRSAQWLAAIGFGIALGGWFLGPAVIHFLYGSLYAGSERPLQILAASVVLTFTNYALTHFLVAIDRRHALMALNLALLIANGLLCMILIPRFGPTGAAIGMVVCESLLFAGCVATLRHARGQTAFDTGTAHLESPL